jgi:hypothetical protein
LLSLPRAEPRLLENAQIAEALEKGQEATSFRNSHTKKVTGEGGGLYFYNADKTRQHLPSIIPY